MVDDKRFGSALCNGRVRRYGPGLLQWHRVLWLLKWRPIPAQYWPVITQPMLCRPQINLVKRPDIMVLVGGVDGPEAAIVSLAIKITAIVVVGPRAVVGNVLNRVGAAASVERVPDGVAELVNIFSREMLQHIERDFVIPNLFACVSIEFLLA